MLQEWLLLCYLFLYRIKYIENITVNGKKEFFPQEITVENKYTRRQTQYNVCEIASNNNRKSNE